MTARVGPSLAFDDVSPAGASGASCPSGSDPARVRHGRRRGGLHERCLRLLRTARPTAGAGRRRERRLRAARGHGGHHRRQRRTGHGHRTRRRTPHHGAGRRRRRLGERQLRPAGGLRRGLAGAGRSPGTPARSAAVVDVRSDAVEPGGGSRPEGPGEVALDLGGLGGGRPPARRGRPPPGADRNARRPRRRRGEPGVRVEETRGGRWQRRGLRPRPHVGGPDLGARRPGPGQRPDVARCRRSRRPHHGDPAAGDDPRAAHRPTGSRPARQRTPGRHHVGLRRHPADRQHHRGRGASGDRRLRRHHVVGVDPGRRQRPQRDPGPADP